jgi:HK97 family phage prohead protease
MQTWNLEWKIERGSVEKAWVLREEDGHKYYYLKGYASDTSIDRDNDRMSPKALNSMKSAIENGMNLFSNHEHGWKDTLGVISKAQQIGNGLYMEVRLEDPQKNKDVDLLLHKLDIGEKLGLSIGGDMVGSHTETDSSLGKNVRVIEDVKLYEVSLVGLPSNPNAYVTGSVYKSFGHIFMDSKSIAQSLLKELDDDLANAVYPGPLPSDSSVTQQVGANTPVKQPNQTQPPQPQQMQDQPYSMRPGGPQGYK